FINMRIAASCVQPLQVNSFPRGALMFCTFKSLMFISPRIVCLSHFWPNNLFISNFQITLLPSYSWRTLSAGLPQPTEEEIRFLYRLLTRLFPLELPLSVLGILFCGKIMYKYV